MRRPILLRLCNPPPSRLCASAGCYGFWCCPCLASTVSSRFGENSCLPFCDTVSLSLSAVLGFPLFGPPPAALALRASIRNRYKIKVCCKRREFQSCGGADSNMRVSLSAGLALRGHRRFLFLRLLLLVPNAPRVELQEEQTHRHQRRQYAACCSHAAQSSDTHLPAAHTDLPPAHTPQPAAHQHLPAAHTHLPVAHTHLPTAHTHLPAAHRGGGGPTLRPPIRLLGSVEET